MKKGQKCQSFSRRVYPLERFGFTSTRAGRWIDPKTGKSLTTTEAWCEAEKRDPERFRRYR